MAMGVAAILYGLDTLNLKAVLPSPLEGKTRNFDTGEEMQSKLVWHRCWVA